MINELHPDMSLSEVKDLTANIFSSWSETARLDAGTLLGHILGKSRAWIAAHPDARLNDQEYKALVKALGKISSGIPLPYVIGHWEFYGLDFIIDPHVLIPRPETELLVDEGLKWFLANPERRLAADIGTGSGCIAVSLAVNMPDLKVYANDISEKALQIARINSRNHGVEQQVNLMQSDLLDALPEPVDAIFANLPYIPSRKLSSLSVYRHEPGLALDGGPDGLEHIRRLMAQCNGKIKSGGMILLEVEAGQGFQALKLAKGIFTSAQISCHQDLARMDRVVSISLSDGSDTISNS
jgi:release factor glutamine methyltransferase